MKTKYFILVVSIVLLAGVLYKANLIPDKYLPKILRDTYSFEEMCELKGAGKNLKEENVTKLEFYEGVGDAQKIITVTDSARIKRFMRIVKETRYVIDKEQAMRTGGNIEGCSVMVYEDTNESGYWLRLGERTFISKRNNQAQEYMSPYYEMLDWDKFRKEYGKWKKEQ